MTITELSIAAAREHLAEARRWCRTQPAAAQAHMEVGIDSILKSVAEGPMSNAWLVMRLRRNLKVGVRYLAACPAMAEGYIDGALFELQAYGARLRRAREARGRDAELAEAYGEARA